MFHFIAIERPETIVWDETWYVGDARSIVSGTGELRPEHPPLAKLFIVAGEYIFNGFAAPEKDTGAKTGRSIGDDGTNDTVIYVSDTSGFRIGMTIRIRMEQMDVRNVDSLLNRITVERGVGGTTVRSHPSQEKIYVYTDNAFGWRFFSGIFGTIGIVIFYFICRKLGFSWKATMLATFLFAAEDMTFLHSGLALLDVYMVTFMLAAVLSYLDRRYILSGIFVALSANCKLAGVLIIIALFLHWVIYRRDKWKTLSASLVVAAVAFVFFLVFFDMFIQGSIENPVTRIDSLLTSTAANQFTVPKLSISSRPWVWLYPQFIDPEYNSPFIVYSYDPQYISFISTTIQILVIPTIGYMIYKAIKGSKAAGLVLLWFLATYLIWIPLNIATNRVTFVFYFLSTTPAICIGIGMGLTDWLHKLKTRSFELIRISPWIVTAYVVIGLYLLIHLGIFVIFNPAIPPIIKTWLPPFV
ncbi:MAG: phospholipid carrier-dependent glycosyltransferase [Dehalococcoidales bacterium]|nr:phospholipid carrier-dependent glycosyltransferase [Dehalococcoidales bacterium]